MAKKKNKKIRSFSTGATRDSNEGKLDYEGFLSPIVLKRYAEYMHKNRVQSDGTLRDSDNWQKHFGKNHYNVCIKSLFRHFMDFWMVHRGFKRYDDKDNHELNIDEIGCAILFNVIAYLDKFLKDKAERRKK